MVSWNVEPFKVEYQNYIVQFVHIWIISLVSKPNDQKWAWGLSRWQRVIKIEAL